MPFPITITPTSARAGETVQIDTPGPNGFDPGVTVAFDGVAATNVVVVSPLRLTCTLPAHAVGASTATVHSTGAVQAAWWPFEEPAVPFASLYGASSLSGYNGTVQLKTAGANGTPQGVATDSATQRYMVGTIDDNTASAYLSDGFDIQWWGRIPVSGVVGRFAFLFHIVAGPQAMLMYWDNLGGVEYIYFQGYRIPGTPAGSAQAFAHQTPGGAAGTWFEDSRSGGGLSLTYFRDGAYHLWRLRLLPVAGVLTWRLTIDNLYLSDVVAVAGDGSTATSGSLAVGGSLSGGASSALTGAFDELTIGSSSAPKTFSGSFSFLPPFIHPRFRINPKLGPISGGTLCDVIAIEGATFFAPMQLIFDSTGVTPIRVACTDVTATTAKVISPPHAVQITDLDAECG